MQSSAQQHAPGRCGDGEAIARVAAMLGLVSLDEAGLEDAHALATQLLGENVAPLGAFLRVRRAAGALLLGFRESGALTGLMAGFPVNQAGRAQLELGAFDPIALNWDLLCWNGQEPAAFYAWGFVASTKEGGRAVVKATAAIHQALLWDTPIFARAVTGDGLRALSSLGFNPAPGGRFLCLAPRIAGQVR